MPFQVQEMMFGTRESFLYFECAQCGCIQISKIPEDIGRFYPETYYSFASRKPAAFQRTRMFLKKHRRFLQFGKRSLLGVLAQSIWGPPKIYDGIKVSKIFREMRVLDIGCGSGKQLLELADEGFINLTGVDAFISQNINYPNGVRIIKGNVSSLEDKFDLIILQHSFEHVAEQRKMLDSISPLMKKTSQLVIMIPVVSPVIWSKYRTKWVQLDAPRHFFLHTPKSFDHLIRQTDLEIYHMEYNSTAFQFWGSEQYLNDIPHISPRSYEVCPAKSIFSKAQIDFYTSEAERMNQQGTGDQAVFYIRKS